MVILYSNEIIAEKSANGKIMSIDAFLSRPLCNAYVTLWHNRNL